MAKIHFLLGLYVLLQMLNTCMSIATANMCLECSRTPTLCRRISGLFTVTVLTEGTYNPVVEIPAPACSINITEFSSSSNYIAVKTASGQGIINSYWGLGQPGQYYGAGVRFSYDKDSGTCKGACIYSEGPTTEAIVVQILYYNKNPGIAYDFILPNSVAFTPFDGTLSKQNSASETPSTTSQPQIRFQQPSAQTHHRRHRHWQSTGDSSSSTDDSEFRGEYYTGTQYSRSEGRPDTTSALEAQIGVKHTSRTSQSQSSHDYTGSRYGSHTLGGRGLSYTYAADPRSQRRDQRGSTSGRQIIERYRSRDSRRPQIVRTVASPQYVSQSQSGTSAYGAQPRYQSFSASTSYLDENNAVEQFDGSNYLKTFNSGHTSLGRGQSLGNSQYEWKISGLTECSQTCGGGVQRTNIVCISVSSRTQVVVTPENCANNLKPGVQTVACNTSPCEPAWEAEEWSECSVTCGSGTQTRTVECRQRFSPSLILSVSADQCGLTDKPAIAQQCEKGLCTQWLTGSWSECSKECGGGERVRSVRCVDKYQSQVPREYCSGTAPRDTEPCNTQSCNAEWWMSDWSAECSESCGQGFRRRTAVCMNDRGEVTPDSLCEKRDLPNMREACRSDAGCRGTWFAGAWSKCSANCGEGTRTRHVVCLGRTVSSLSIAGDEECDAALKPETEESCVNTQCDVQWYTSSWSECSVTCGEGYRTREVRCIENNQRQSHRCIGSLKPDSKEVCSLSPCSSRYQYQRINRFDANSGYNSYSDDNTEETLEDYSKEEDEVDDITLEDVEDSGDKDDKSVSSYRSEDHSSPETSCKDSYWNCLMVTQARLCSYSYYKGLCCRSCRKAGYN